VHVVPTREGAVHERCGNVRDLRERNTEDVHWLDELSYQFTKRFPTRFIRLKQIPHEPTVRLSRDQAETLQARELDLERSVREPCRALQAMKVKIGVRMNGVMRD
jgi:hypothetical protein